MTDKDKAPEMALKSPDTNAVNAENSAMDSRDFDVCVPAEKLDKLTHPLLFPFTYGGNEVTEFVMRRPKLMDKHLAESRSEDDFDVMVDILSAVCGVEEDLLLEMDEEYDFAKLIDLFKRFKETADIEANTLILTYPFTLPAKGKNKARDITEITLRRPNLKDSMSYKKEKIGDKIARLAGFKKRELLGMDLKTDWEGLIKIYNSFQERLSR